MATLTAYTKFDRTTIADGDKLSANIAANASNDNAMLAESLSTYSKIKESYDTVKAYSANEWDNNKLHNFSKLVVNGTTIQGKPKLADKFTFSAKNGVTLRKNSQNAYEFSASPEIVEVSSYYKYSKFSSEVPLTNSDPFIFEGNYFTIAWLSWAQHESYCQNDTAELLNGFSKTNADTSKFDTLTVTSALNNLAYKSTTRILTSADLPTDEGSKDIKRLSHTIPWRGSFVYTNFYAASYKGAAIVDHNSISYLHNNFAQDCSIAISLKGASAKNNSFVFGDATNVEQTASKYHIGMIAVDNSTCFGPGALASNKSITITPTGACDANKYLVSAFNKSISLESCGMIRQDNAALYLDNSFACQVNGDTRFSAVSSIVMQCALETRDSTASAIQATNSLLTYKFSYWRSDSTLTYVRKFANAIINDSVDIATNLSNVSNSICIGVKGTSFDTSAAISAVNAVVMQTEVSNNKANSITNSILFGLTTNAGGASGNNFTDTYAIYAGCVGSVRDSNVKDIYAVANIMYNYDKHTCFLCTEANENAYADITGYYDNFAACKCLCLPGSGNIAIKGNSWTATHKTNERVFYNNLVIGQPYINTNSAIGIARKTQVANNVIYQPAPAGGFIGASACFIFADSNIHGCNIHGVSAFEANNSIALQHSNCYSNNSIAIANSTIEESTIVERHDAIGVDTTPNYCFAYANSTARKLSNALGDTSDIEQLSMWNNTLKKAHLTKSKFKHLTEITSLDDMQENIYYIVG